LGQRQLGQVDQPGYLAKLIDQVALYPKGAEGARVTLHLQEGCCRHERCYKIRYPFGKGVGFLSIINKRERMPFIHSFIHSIKCRLLSLNQSCKRHRFCLSLFSKAKSRFGSWHQSRDPLHPSPPNVNQCPNF
jgi:hypothetical protein